MCGFKKKTISIYFGGEFFRGRFRENNNEKFGSEFWNTNERTKTKKKIGGDVSAI